MPRFSWLKGSRADVSSADRLGCSHGRRLFAVRAVKTGAQPTGEPAHQRKLAAMVDAVREDQGPEDLTDRDHLVSDKRDRSIQFLRPQLTDTCHRFAMNPL